MPISKKLVTGVTTGVLLGALVGVTAPLATDAQADSEEPTTPADARTGDDSATVPLTEEVRDAIAELEANRAEIVAQQNRERAEAAEILIMPPGTDFGPTESVEAIDTQIEALRAPDGAQILASSSMEYPTLQWYEDGFFASMMANDWQCAWLSTGVSQVEAGDTAGVAETVETLRSFSSTEYAAAFVDYEDRFLPWFVEPLLDGDTSGAYDYLSSCNDSARVDSRG